MDSRNDREPTLAQFLDLLDTLAVERRRDAAHGHPTSLGPLLSDTLEQAAQGAPTDDDRAWARLHYQIFGQGYVKDTPEHAAKRAQLYREFGDNHPALVGLAWQTAEQWGG